MSDRFVGRALVGRLASLILTRGQHHLSGGYLNLTWLYRFFESGRSRSSPRREKLEILS